METTTKTGAEMIAAERQRQTQREGWDEDHDDQHEDGQLAMAAVCYATPDSDRHEHEGVPLDWPFEDDAWKPCPADRIREPVKAGALIAAEIDRLQRLAP